MPTANPYTTNESTTGTHKAPPIPEMKQMQNGHVTPAYREKQNPEPSEARKQIISMTNACDRLARKPT